MRRTLSKDRRSLDPCKWFFGRARIVRTLGDQDVMQWRSVTRLVPGAF